MRVCFCMNAHIQFGGAERRLLRILNAVGKHHDVILLAGRCNSRSLSERLNEASVQLDHLKAVVPCGDGKLSSALKTVSKIAHLRPDVTMLFDESMQSIIISLLPRTIRGFLLLPICYGRHEELYSHGNRNLELEIILRRVDWVDLLYPSQILFFEKLSGGKPTITITPGSFTDLNLYKPTRKKKRIVLLTARLEGYKGIDRLLDACALCKEELILAGYQVLICGEGPSRSYYEKKIDEMRLGRIISLPGYLPSFQILPSAQVACNVADISNYPSQTLIEALSSGCYVIATDTPGTKDVASPNVCKLVSLDPTSTAEALCEYIYKSQRDKDEIVRRARQYAEKKFSIDSSVNYYNYILNNINSNKTR